MLSKQIVFTPLYAGDIKLFFIICAASIHRRLPFFTTPMLYLTRIDQTPFRFRSSHAYRLRQQMFRFPKLQLSACLANQINRCLNEMHRDNAPFPA